MADTVSGYGGTEVSIITANFNGAAHLDQLLQSVGAQHGVRFEHIVIDGGSTDESGNILYRHASGLAHWVSEPDEGIADAMNKGIRVAGGKWLLFLHSDDYLTDPHALNRAMTTLKDSTADIAVFPIFLEYEKQQKLSHPVAGCLRPRFKPPPHQSTFFRRSAFERWGLYSTRFRISMDYDFIFRAWRGGARIEFYNARPVTVMRLNGVSSRRDWKTLRQRFIEEKTIHFQYARTWREKALYSLYWSTYLPYRWIRAFLAGTRK